MTTYKQERELKKILKNVRKDFSEIKWKIPIEYSEYAGDVITQINYSNQKGKVYLIETKIVVPTTPDWFYKLPYEEKKSIIAHEFGHLERIRKIKNVTKLNRISNWVEDFARIMKDHKTYLRLEMTRDWARRHIKRYLLEEIYADTQTVDRGHGEGLLSFLKRFNKPGSFFDYRLKNLEKILNNL